MIGRIVGWVPLSGINWANLAWANCACGIFGLVAREKVQALSSRQL